MSKKVNFDDFTENYNTLLHEKTGFFSPSEEYFARYKIDIVRNNVIPPRSILEYGCGIGRNIPFLRTAFPDAMIVGSDVSKGCIEVARENNPDAKFFQEDELLSFADQFDLIFVAGVFHHIPPSQRIDAAAKLFQRLKLGGQIIIFEHNPFNPVTNRIVRTCVYDADAVLLKPAEMKHYLRQTGFLIEKKSFCLFFPPNFSKLTHLENYLGWLPLGGQYWIKARRVKCTT